MGSDHSCHALTVLLPKFEIAVLGHKDEEEEHEVVEAEK